MLVAAAPTASAVVLAVSLRRICAEVDLLRRSMRRARAAGAAADELQRLIGDSAAKLRRLEDAPRIRPRRGQAPR